jgi:hypothetical protein
MRVGFPTPLAVFLIFQRLILLLQILDFPTHTLHLRLLPVTEVFGVYLVLLTPHFNGSDFIDVFREFEQFLEEMLFGDFGMGAGVFLSELGRVLEPVNGIDLFKTKLIAHAKVK